MSSDKTREALEAALTHLKAQAEWHTNYDDFVGWFGSELQEQHAAAVAKIESALASSAADAPRAQEPVTDAQEARDAERYRFLRDTERYRFLRLAPTNSPPADGSVWVVRFQHPAGSFPKVTTAGFDASLDAAVDAAIAAEQGEGKA